MLSMLCYANLVVASICFALLHCSMLQGYPMPNLRVISNLSKQAVLLLLNRSWLLLKSIPDASVNDKHRYVDSNGCIFEVGSSVSA